MTRSETAPGGRSDLQRTRDGGDGDNGSLCDQKKTSLLVHSIKQTSQVTEDDTY